MKQQPVQQAGQINMPAAIVFTALVVCGIVAIYLKSDGIGGALIAAALGQLGPSPFKAVR